MTFATLWPILATPSLISVLPLKGTIGRLSQPTKLSPRQLSNVLRLCLAASPGTLTVAIRPW